MKLFLIHCGYYDQSSQGIFESHTNFFVAASDTESARKRAKQLDEYKERRMHIDGVVEINSVDGFTVNLD